MPPHRGVRSSLFNLEVLARLVYFTELLPGVPAATDGLILLIAELIFRLRRRYPVPHFSNTGKQLNYPEHPSGGGLKASKRMDGRL